MTDAWITTSSTNPEAVLNPLIAACENEFVPDVLYHLESDDITDEMATVRNVARKVVETYGEKDLEIERTSVPSDPDFELIHEHIRTAIDTIDEDGAVAVDITPGRKFMSAIAFATGMRHDADHVYYLYLKSSHYGLLYPELPRTATRLYDFTEVL